MFYHYFFSKHYLFSVLLRKNTLDSHIPAARRPYTKSSLSGVKGAVPDGSKRASIL